MILCYEVGRKAVHGMDYMSLKPLAELREVYETMASLQVPSRVIGVAMNSRQIVSRSRSEQRARASPCANWGCRCAT